MAIFGILYLYLFALPFIGIAQLIGLIYRCNKLKERQDAFALKLKDYASMVKKYLAFLILFSFLLWAKPSGNASELLSTIFFLYLTVIPGFMAIYYWRLIWRNSKNLEIE